MIKVRLNSSYDSNVGIGDGYVYKFNREGYDFYAKKANDTYIWKAIKQEAADASEAFEVTYKQARGFEPIRETPLQKRMREVLRMDEWNKVNSCGNLNSAYDPNDTLEDLWQFVQEQKFDSRKTSKKQVARTFSYGFSKGWFQPGDVVVDYGGGAFDYAIEYCTDRDVICAVYDPFNRSAEYNKETMALVHKAGGADIVTCNNVLNVIEEEPVRLTVLNNINRIVKQGGSIYFLIHEGDGTGNSRVTQESKYIDENGEEQITTSWQNHQKTDWYLDAIKSIWPQAKKTNGNLIVVENA